MKGLDLLGIGSKAWNMGETIKGFPTGFALGFFADNTFGPNAIANATKLIATGRIPAVRAHLHWSTAHQIIPIDKLKNLAPKIEALAKKFLGVKFYISHSCEYSEHSVVAIQQRMDLIKQLAPSCIPVQTPMNSPVIPGYMTEQHGSNAHAGANQIASTDGQNLYDIDAAQWTNKNGGSEISFAWGMRFNLTESGPLLPPPQRTAAPSARYIQGVARLLSSPGIAPNPTFSGKIIPINKPYLLKTFSEDMPGANSRDNLPLLIAKGASPQCQVVTKDGAALGAMKVFDHPGAYPGGLTRYYAGLPGGINLYGYEIAQKALQMSGSEFVWFHVDNVFYGPANPAFRVGFFR